MIWPFRRRRDSEKAMKAAAEVQQASERLKVAIREHDAAINELFEALIPPRERND